MRKSGGENSRIMDATSTPTKHRYNGRQHPQLRISHRADTPSHEGDKEQRLQVDHDKQLDPFSSRAATAGESNALRQNWSTPSHEAQNDMSRWKRTGIAQSWAYYYTSHQGFEREGIQYGHNVQRADATREGVIFFFRASPPKQDRRLLKNYLVPR